MKRKLLAVGATLMILGGCQADNTHQKDYRSTEDAEVATHQQESMRSYLELSSPKLKLVGSQDNGLYYVTGQIDNKHTTQRIDKIVDMVFLDKDDIVVAARPYSLNIGPGETIYFEELAGQTKHISRPARVIIKGIDD